MIFKLAARERTRMPMKINHKLCVRMDGTQFLILWWFTAKNEGGNDIIAWVYNLLTIASFRIGVPSILFKVGLGVWNPKSKQT